MNKYYVYEWIRLDTNEPFYIGKGCKNRWKLLTRENNEHFNNIVKTIPVAVNILHKNLDEETAFGLECWYIHEYKYIIGYDLVNITDGGEGIGLIGDKNPKSKKIICLNNLKTYDTLTDAAKTNFCNINSISQCCYGNNSYAGKQNNEKLVWRFLDDYYQLSEETIKDLINRAQESKVKENNSFYGKTHTEETREKLRQYNLGKKYSETTKKKLSEMRQGENNAMYGKRGELSPHFGKPKSQECKNKLSYANGTHIKCIELNMTFTSLTNAEKYIKENYIKTFNRRTLKSFLEEKSRSDYYGEIIQNGIKIKLHWEYI